MLTKIWLAINFLFFTYLGLGTLYNYSKINEYTYYILDNPAAIAEYKATYGGLMLAIAFCLAFYSLRYDIYEAVLFLGIIYTGYATGRAFGIIFNSSWGVETTTTFFLSEIFGAIFSFGLCYLKKI